MDSVDQIQVRLNGGGPWGFRLQGGAGTGLPLIVSKVRRKSKAYKKLYEGDIILSVNGRSCEMLTYDQVMEIADKNGTDLVLELTRQESNKENLAPSSSMSSETTTKTFTNVVSQPEPANKEMVSLTETSTKIIEEKEGLRIKSATLLQDTTTPKKPFEDIISNKLEDVLPNKAEADAFPSYSEVLQSSEVAKETPADLSTSSKTEEITGDANNFVKTTVETMKEIKGNKKTTVIKKEQESMTKSSNINEFGKLPNTTLETRDLNDLINETQKKLESFKDGFKPTVDSSSKAYEMTKTEVTSNTAISEHKSSDTLDSHDQFSSLSGDSKIPYLNTTVDIKKELESSTGGLGFTSSDTETSSYVSESPFGASLITKKKKMFSSSSFYEEPNAIYPTMEEQVEMAKKIADSLADDTNKKSKGANMFFKRVKRSTKWIHEGPEPSDESSSGTPEIPGMEPPTPDPSQVPWKPHKGPPRLKLVLDPRQPQDALTLRSSGYIISEHNVVSPEVCHDLVKDLQSPVGKGAALFAKRKKKSEEWVVDEEKVKALLKEREKSMGFGSPIPPGSQYPTIGRQEVKLVKTPWEAAMESPYGRCDAAFARVHPEKLADTVIKAADYKRTISGTDENVSTLVDGCRTPTPLPVTPAGAYYDIYHAKAPKGWIGGTTSSTIETSTPVFSSPIPDISRHEPISLQNGYSPPKKMVFQNFNAVPRLWKKTTT